MTTKAKQGEDLFMKHKTREKKKKQMSIDIVSVIAGCVDSETVNEHLG